MKGSNRSVRQAAERRVKSSRSRDGRSPRTPGRGDSRRRRPLPHEMPLDIFCFFVFLERCAPRELGTPRWLGAPRHLHCPACWKNCLLAADQESTGEVGDTTADRQNFGKISAKCGSFSAVSVPIFVSKCAFFQHFSKSTRLSI